MYPASRITIRQLEIFVAICQESTVTGAAHRIGLSQAAASQALSELENLLERKLFDRHGRRLALNEAGRALLPDAFQLLDRVRAIESPQTRQVRRTLVASLTAGNYLLPPILARFGQQEGGFGFQLVIGNTDQVVSALLRFEAEAGWVEGPVQEPELLQYPWREDELVIVAPSEHRLAGKHATPTDLEACNWVLRERGSGTRSAFEEAIGGRFQFRKIVLEAGGIEAVKLSVLAGAGLACLSIHSVAAELESGSLGKVSADWLNLRRQITVLIHREKFLDAGLYRFLDFCGIWKTEC